MLWKDALNKSPDKFRPAYNYATALRKMLELDRAKQVYLWAKRNDPENEKVDWALNLVEEAQKYPDLIKQLRKALEENPEKPSNGQ
jgi:tetratricopeptide (TPR) repeat protein